MDLVSKVQKLISKYQFSHFGIVPIDKPLSLDIYKQWINDGYYGEMTYLKDHLPIKEDLRNLAPKAQTAIVVAKNYYPHPYKKSAFPKSRIALYSQGEDYHIYFKKELEDFASALKKDFEKEEFLCFTDSSPVLERDLGHQAGLGWIGKNTCLIHPKIGSLFFIGQILCSLPTNNSAPLIKDFCGTCDRCITACPTQALEAPRKLNPHKCIAYWTIEAKNSPPPNLQEKFSDWLFGCDICQTVCPWNEKAFGKEAMQVLSMPERTTQFDDLRWILRSSNKAIEKQFKSSPLLRARPRGLKRNALIVIGNLKVQELKPEVMLYIDDPRLNEIAQWALSQLR